MKQSLHMQMSQQLSLSPQLQQAIRLLQLSAVELQDEIQQLLESNPMLESDEAPQAVAEMVVPDQSAVEHSIPEKAAATKSASDETCLDTIHLLSDNHAESLNQQLLTQLRLAHLQPMQAAVGVYLIDAIDEDGYLRCELCEVVDALSTQYAALTEQMVEATLKIIQTFEPAGVGARTVQECLVLQLQQLPASVDGAHALHIVTHHLEALSRGEHQKIQNRCQLSESQLQCALSLIHHLNPRPGASIGQSSIDYIIPDVSVKKSSGRWVVRLNGEMHRPLRLNQTYMHFIKRADTSADNVFLKDCLKEARWFLNSIENRHHTLLKVATKIVEVQHAFLTHGEVAMKPMVLQDIAEATELHESTISRITTNKYIHTPRGVFELKYFFSSHVNTQNGQACSSTAIRALIKQIVRDEPPTRPFSDNQIAAMLQKQGICVARRTIAKYRESLGIASSSDRRRYAHVPVIA